MTGHYYYLKNIPQKVLKDDFFNVPNCIYDKIPGIFHVEVNKLLNQDCTEESRAELGLATLVDISNPTKIDPFTAY